MDSTPTDPPQPGDDVDSDALTEGATAAPADPDATLIEARPPSPPPAPAGSVILDRRFHHYEVCLLEDGTTFHELGRGAMGVSYKARDVNLDSFVAIKVIRSANPGLANVRERFRREARAAAQLRHPNVASVYHFGETPAGECFYAMEFIEGETLAARVRRDGPMAAPLVVDIALQVTAALMAADERGLVHRDLKPANLMLVTPRPPRRKPVSGTASATGSHAMATVKVIDFGLAKAAAGAEPEAPLTQDGGFLGTPAYASPEQAEGEVVDARSDIYSLGVTLWFLLTAKVPFAGRSMSEIYDRQVHRPLPLTQLTDIDAPAPLVDLLVRMLATDPDQRPASPAALQEELERVRTEQWAHVPASAPPARSGWALPVAAALALALVAVLAGLGLYFARNKPSVGTANAQPSAPPIPAPPAAPDHSLAVLPLQDLSEDKSNAFFADGIQDDLLNSLAKIKDLKVISRSSVVSYRNSNRDLREIARQLGVTTLLEGSVRRGADRVVVNVALIDAGTLRQLWSERYDRTLEDSLTLQGELATEIASALKATLSPEEKEQVETRPTGNAEAYVLYLRARDYQTRPTGLLQDYQTAENLYTEALKLDPNFALAHARLATILAYSYKNFTPTHELHDRAFAEAEAALRLAPGAGEGHLARALCWYWTEHDYEAALREMDVAGRLLPGSAEIDFFSGAIRRRQGRWSQALASMKRAQILDPRSTLIAREVMLTVCMLRNWPAAERSAATAVALAPDLTMLQIERCYIPIWAKRDVGPLKAALAAAPAGFDPDGEVTFARWDAAMLLRDFAGAEKVVGAGSPDSVETVFGAVLPRDYLMACAALAGKDATRARALFQSALPAMEAEAKNVPLDAFRQVHLGLLYAFLDRKEDALRLGRRAAELLSETKDAYYGPSVSGMLALIYARTKEPDAALALLTRLLATPAALSPNFNASITQADLALRWEWDPLRQDPRFQALLAGPEPKTEFK